MKVLILAGGEGKRLRPLTESVPKPLVKINGRAIIDYQIDQFRKLGLREFVVLSCYKNSELLNHFARYEGADVKVVVEDKPLGTGGAIRLARQSAGAGDFIVVNGDIMTDLDLAPMLSGGKDILAKIALVPMVSPYGVVKTSRNKVTGFDEKVVLDEVWINAGVYWMSESIFDLLPESGSLEKDVFPKLASEGKLGFSKFQLQDRFWRSIDTIKDHEDAGRRFGRASGI